MNPKGPSAYMPGLSTTWQFLKLSDNVVILALQSTLIIECLFPLVVIQSMVVGDAQPNEPVKRYLSGSRSVTSIGTDPRSDIKSINSGT